MAIRYAGKYHRSPYQQATRIPVKNILLFAILIIGGGGDVLASPSGQIFLLRGRHIAYIPPTSHTGVS